MVLVAPLLLASLLMRRLRAPLLSAALGAFGVLVLAVPRVASAVEPSPAPPVALPSPEAAKPAPAAGGVPTEDPAYQASQHGGLSYSEWLIASRGTARRSTGMMITGLSLLGIGASLAATGTGIYAAGDPCITNQVRFEGSAVSPCGARTSHITGTAILVSGVIALGIAIPLTALGASQVPRAEAARLDGEPAARARSFVSLSLGLRGGGIALHF